MDRRMAGEASTRREASRLCEPNRLGPARGRLCWPYIQVRLLEQEVGRLFIDMVERKWVRSTNEKSTERNQDPNKTRPKQWKRWQNPGVVMAEAGASLGAPGEGRHCPRPGPDRATSLWRRDTVTPLVKRPSGH